MPQLSTYDQLPEAVKAEINDLIKEFKFSNYVALTEAVNARLAEYGLEVQFSKSALHRVGQDLKGVLESIRYSQEAAAYLAEAFPDEQRNLNRAAIALVQDKMFRLILEAQRSGAELSAKELASISRAIADLVRADVSESKYREEVRAKLQAKFVELEKPSRQLDPETLRVVREEIYGLVG